MDKKEIAMAWILGILLFAGVGYLLFSPLIDANLNKNLQSLSGITQRGEQGRKMSPASSDKLQSGTPLRSGKAESR